MPKIIERLPGPSQGPVCPLCRFWWPAVTASVTALDRAEHDVYHFEWESQRTGVPPRVGLEAYRRLLPLLRAAHGERAKHLNRQLCDREEEVADVTYDLSVANGVIADRDALIEDLEADLYQIRNGRPADA